MFPVDDIISKYRRFVNRTRLRQAVRLFLSDNSADIQVSELAAWHGSPYILSGVQRYARYCAEDSALAAGFISDDIAFWSDMPYCGLKSVVYPESVSPQYPFSPIRFCISPAVVPARSTSAKASFCSSERMEFFRRISRSSSAFVSFKRSGSSLQKQIIIITSNYNISMLS